ncbi:hypothetical protein [Frisingicoccus sp.]
MHYNLDMIISLGYRVKSKAKSKVATNKRYQYCKELS